MQNIRSAVKRGVLATAALALLVPLWACTAPGVNDAKWVVTPEDLLKAEYKSALCKSDAFLDYALRPVDSGNPKKRDNTHAPSIPMRANRASDALKEVMRENCGNPTELYMTLQGLIESKPAGIDFGAHNKWATEFLATAKDKGLRVLCLSHKDEKSDAIVVAAYCQKTAAMANVLLLRAENAGFDARKSLRNWYVSGDDPVLELPLTVENPKQESLPALVLEFTEKGVGCQAAIAYNKRDKRFEVVPCSENPPVHPPTNPPSSPPTPPPPGKVPVCAPDGKSIIYVPKKDAHKYKKPDKNGLCEKRANDDPAHHGNAGNGGGHNQDPGPGPTTTPTTVPTTPRPTVEPPKSSESPRPSPAPTKEKPTDPPATGKPEKP